MMTSVLPHGDFSPMKRCNTSIMPTKETNEAQLQGFYWPRYVTLPTSKNHSEKVKPVKATRARKNSFSKERQQIEACLKLLPKTSLDIHLDFENLLATPVSGEAQRQPQHSYAWNPRSSNTAAKASKPVSRLVPAKMTKKHSQRKSLRKSEKQPSCKG